MVTSEMVNEQVAAIVRRHLESKFGDQLAIDEIRIVPRVGYFGDEYLHIYVIFDGDGDLLEPKWINGLYRRMRPEFLELGIAGIPVDSYIDKAEIAEWTDEERARLFR